MAVAGKVMPRAMGAYSPSVVYGVLDVVSHNSKPWICKKNNTVSIEPSASNSEYWQLLLDVSITDADTVDGYHADSFLFKEAASRQIEVTFLAGGWVGTEAPYTQTVTANGMTETDCPMPIFVDDGENETSSKAKLKGYGFISYFDSANGSVTATCKYKKPEANVKVLFKGV